MVINFLWYILKMGQNNIFVSGGGGGGGRYGNSSANPTTPGPEFND